MAGECGGYLEGGGVMVGGSFCGMSDFMERFTRRVLMWQNIG